MPPHGAVGPRVAGPEAFLTSGTNGTWTTDGAGILYTDSCLTIPPVPFGSIHGMAMQPATGGSATWVRCENRAPLIFSRDSDELFFTPALNPKGKLLYIEAVGYNVNAPIPCLCLPFPNGWHADLWTDDSGFAPGTRRRLMTLYRDHLGVVTDTLAVNWLSDVTWSGDNTFIALAGNLHPPIVLNSFGVFRGIIAGTASISLVDGTSGARLFSLARAGATIVFVNDSLTIREISSTGGAVSVVAKIPVGDERYIRDLSCVADRCLVITSDGARPPQTFWSVTLTTGTIAILRIDDRGSTRARLSPDGTRVLVTAPSGVYLYSDLRP
ncbi:MAG: hypothetical protein ACREK8_03275 [Gemmatimonadales bacterium]